MKRKKIVFNFEGYDKGWVMKNPILFIQRCLEEIKWFCQRGWYGYADVDWWGLDGYLSEWIPSALRRIKKGDGYPGRGEANTYKKWQAIVEEIAQGFEAHYELMNGFPKKDRMEKLIKIEKRGLKLFAKWYDALWD